MAYQDYQVRITFTKDESGATSYTLPYVYHISDPQEGMKATVIRGNRGDGSIVIPGGKLSQEITVTTDQAIVAMEHYDGGWVTDWSYTVRRIDSIRFPKSFRTSSQKYEINFLVLAYS